MLAHLRHAIVALAALGQVSPLLAQSFYDAPTQGSLSSELSQKTQGAVFGSAVGWGLWGLNTAATVALGPLGVAGGALLSMSSKQALESMPATERAILLNKDYAWCAGDPLGHLWLTNAVAQPLSVLQYGWDKAHEWNGPGVYFVEPPPPAAQGAVPNIQVSPSIESTQNWAMGAEAIALRTQAVMPAVVRKLGPVAPQASPSREAPTQKAHALELP